MSLERWTLGVEILSAVAVVATLIVLIVEVREGNRVTSIAAYQKVTWQFNEARRDLIEDPGALEAFLSGLRGGQYPSWDSREAYKLSAHLLNQFNTFNVAFLAYESGIIGDGEWRRLERGICAIFASLPEEYRREQRSTMTDDFIAHIDANC